jgi:hypothetical protein
MNASAQVINPVVSDIVSALVGLSAFFAWGIAAVKSFTIWKDWKKKTIILMAIGFGKISWIAGITSVIARHQLPGLPGVLILRNVIGCMGLFLTIYHVLMLYIKVLRLHLTRRVGDKAVATILIFMNVVYGLVQIAWSIGFAMIGWDPVYGNFQPGVPTTFIQTLSMLSTAEVFLGVFVELATIFFFRSVMIRGHSNFSLSALGPIEYISVLAAIWTMICTIAGSMLNYEFDFFNTNVPGAVLLYQAVICLSIVMSVDEVKQTYKSNRSQPQSATIQSTQPTSKPQP